jgi:hypothetical protein
LGDSRHDGIGKKKCKNAFHELLFGREYSYIPIWFKKKLPVAAGSSCCIPTTLFCVFFPLHFDEMQYSQKVTRGNEISVYKVV